MRALSDDRILDLAVEWHQSGHDLAIAIVIQTWGSSPRPAGSVMIIRDDGHIEGSVSGGCVESAVMQAANDVMINATATQLNFDVADEDAWQVGLSCGGAISVWICASTAKTSHMADLFVYIKTQFTQQQAVVIDCHIDQHMMTIARTDQPANTLSGDGTCFRLSVDPQPRLYIIGAVHISQHLAPMAMAAGFDVNVIDPRISFINEARFPDTTLIKDWPDDILDAAALDHMSAVVTLTHDPKLDDAALRIALHRPVFYIASLGSRRTHAKRCDRLKQDGFTDEQLARISAPAGCDIKARTPAEIAVSILAELIAIRRGAVSVSAGMMGD